MRDIKGHDTFVRIEPLNKGWSSDQKYVIETADGRRLLLRVADISEYDRKKAEFEMMHRVAALGIPMSQPVYFGVCDGGKSVYQLLSWIDGEDAEAVLPKLTETEQYTLGLEAGELLKKMQALSAARPSSEWMKGYGAKLLRYIQNYRHCGLTFEGDALLIEYITERIHLLDNRPTCFTHDDYHPGNMILTTDKKLFIIDFQRFRNVEPYHAMSGLIFSAQKSPHFASGQIHGYFQGEPPADFWELLSLYMAAIAVNALPWSIPFGADEIDFAYRQIADVLAWFDHMQNPVPAWYLQEWQALGLAQRPQSWLTCDETVRRYITGLVDLFLSTLLDNLAGVYLHGSLATGSYFPPKSDIDLIVVVKQRIESGMAQALHLAIAQYAQASPTVGGIELSVISAKTASTAPSEMPYELHYSESWYQRILDDQVEYGTQPVDPDLQAHVRCVKKRGICLYGMPINEAFGEVKWQSFLAAIREDFDWIAEGEDILESPYYGVLNICRVLQALRENNPKERSKLEGAVWGLRNLPQEYRPLIRKALAAYASNAPIGKNERKTGGVDWDKATLLAFRDYAKAAREKGSQPEA